MSSVWSLHVSAQLRNGAGKPDKSYTHRNIKQRKKQIYIYRERYVVKLKFGPRFGGFKVKKWSKFKVKIGPSFFFFFTVLAIFIVFWGYAYKHK